MKAKFGREPKMMTTEPSADKVKGDGMKKGGKAMGGAMISRDAMPMAKKRAMPMQAPLLARKKGGEAESKSMQNKEDREIKKVEKELKHHESMSAKKAHHGLKKGGSTGEVRAPGYKDGGHVAMTCKSEGGFTVHKKMQKC